MADFSNPNASVASMAMGNAGLNTGTTGSMRDTQYASDDLWDEHDSHFREQHARRPFARADRSYEYYQPAYRYGFDSARQHAGREWNDAEGDLERGWDRARGTSQGAWHDVKDAARDAWDRVRGHGDRR